MPVHSKAQWRFLGWAQNHGVVAPNTLHKWAAISPSFKSLPERVGPRHRARTISRNRSRMRLRKHTTRSTARRRR